MDTSEVIAVIRDISIIILIALWLIGMVAAGVIGIRIYRSVKHIAERVKQSYQTIRNGLVRPLLRMRSSVSTLGRIPRRQSQAREGEMRISKGSLIMVMTGVSVGVLAGLLLAPKPGRQTRQMLKRQAGALKDQASQHATSLRNGQQDGANEQAENSAASGEMEVLVRSDRRGNQGQRRRQR
jgi:gas vesicle protein